MQVYLREEQLKDYTIRNCWNASRSWIIENLEKVRLEHGLRTTNEAFFHWADKFWSIWGIFGRTKGQIKPKADWRVVDSPKKRTNKFILFTFSLFTANKTKSFICLWENLPRANPAFSFFLPLSAPILVQWVPCPCFPLFLQKARLPNIYLVELWFEFLDHIELGIQPSCVRSSWIGG